MATAIVGQGNAAPIPQQHEGVEIEKTTMFDYFRGQAAALIAAGVLESRHLEQLTGRRKGAATDFMPDGSDVPHGVRVDPSLAGAFSVRVLPDGRREVRRTVSASERQRREEAEPTLRRQSAYHEMHSGSRAALLRDGIPDRWLCDVIVAGKKRGRKVMYEGEREIKVSGSEKGYCVEVTHINFYCGWRRDLWLRKRAEFGLPLVVRGHLSLVWSAPPVRAH